MKNETFIVKILFTQNSSWQGTVDWCNKKGGAKTQSFRSALELIRLIDTAVGTERKEWEEAESSS